MEALPPLLVLEGTGLDRTTVGAAELIGERSRRCYEIRADSTGCRWQKKCRRKYPVNYPAKSSSGLAWPNQWRSILL